jgi:hypothetical protein
VYTTSGISMPGVLERDVSKPAHVKKIYISKCGNCTSELDYVSMLKNQKIETRNQFKNTLAEETVT